MRRRRNIYIALCIVAAVIAVGAVAFWLWTRYGAGPRAPRIGLSLSTLWYDRMRLQPAPFRLALARAGANVRDLEPGDRERIDELLDGLDGLVLAGGGDVDPALFGGDASKAAGVVRERDDFEIELLKKAEERGIPVLAVRRGSQMLAVAYGGKLDKLGEEGERTHGVTLKSFSAHTVTIREGTRLHAAMGAGPHKVSSTHVQAIVDPGPRLRVAAVAEDGVIEAIELPGDRFVVGIQWHPELESITEDLQMAPFRMLVESVTK